MAQYNFTTNIEKRMPATGEVFFVDRMTSDYAQAHPFDVNAFLESIFQKWQDCETVAFRETREALRRQWDKTLGERNPRGNAALYPNKNGDKHPALMEVWHKAGDYWRRGLRLGDVLPAVIPATKITRTDSGWIALFPKDAALLNEQPAAEEGTTTVSESTARTAREQQERQQQECKAKHTNLYRHAIAASVTAAFALLLLAVPGLILPVGLLGLASCGLVK